MCNTKIRFMVKHFQTSEYQKRRGKMTEVEIIDAINKKRAELEEKKGQNADGAVLTAIEKEIEELTMSLQPVEKSRDQKAFLDECAG